MRKLISGETTALTKPFAPGCTSVMSFTFYGPDQIRVTDALFHDHGITEYAWSTMSSGIATRAEAVAAWKRCLARGYVATGKSNIAA